MIYYKEISDFIEGLLGKNLDEAIEDCMYDYSLDPARFSRFASRVECKYDLLRSTSYEDISKRIKIICSEYNRCSSCPFFIRKPVDFIKGCFFTTGKESKRNKYGQMLDYFVREFIDSIREEIFLQTDSMEKREIDILLDKNNGNVSYFYKDEVENKIHGERRMFISDIEKKVEEIFAEISEVLVDNIIKSNT